MEIWSGSPYPLGATVESTGTNFAVFSGVAERVELCLFDDEGHETRIRLPETTAHVWHGHVEGVGPGQRYGYRVHGPYDPASGARCNPAKLLIDPYALAIEGDVDWDEAVYGYHFDHPDGDLSRSDADSALFVPKSVVVDRAFDWGDDRPPATPLHESTIYEVHVKGFTERHPAVAPELRGTYAGLMSEQAIEHLLQLGITAVELMPVHQFVDDHRLQRLGLHNYWGYNTIGYFAPHYAYSSSGASGGQVVEFKSMVKALHAAGIEVILDVVYNHTAEGDHHGPTLSFRGLDNAAYYRLVEHDRRHYMDYTGTGNTLNMRNPFPLQLLMDSLRYWVTECHVDGFRFDLAATLARTFHDVDRLSAFFDVIQQDPVVSRVKLIAEPWDVGDGGYQVGNFPPLWAEWNGRYRDCMRDFWRHENTGVAEFANRLTGSSDLYGDDRRPFASINFVTAHDGFTLADLVSYDHKHNEANGENGQDGENHNRSWNCGVEGPTDDEAVNQLRARQQRNLLTTLFVSQGVPMLLGGDEMGRTQVGNNNAYCQDNEVSWFDWSGFYPDIQEPGDPPTRAAAAHVEMYEFTRRLVELRQAHPVLRLRRWFQGRPIRGSGVDDIAWFGPDGSEMTDEDWSVGFAKALVVFLNGEAIASLGPKGERVVDDSLLLVFNAHEGPLKFTLPEAHFGEQWEVVIDTTEPAPVQRPAIGAGQALEVEGRSVVVLVHRRE